MSLHSKSRVLHSRNLVASVESDQTDGSKPNLDNLRSPNAMAANPIWNDARLSAQRPAARALPLPSPVLEASAEALGSRARLRRRDLAIPSWVVFCMIMLATFAVCVSVTMRAQAEMRGAEQKYEQMSADVQRIRETNAALQKDIERLHNKDPRAVEAAARARLNMVRSNEVVVPLQ